SQRKRECPETAGAASRRWPQNHHPCPINMKEKTREAPQKRRGEVLQKKSSSLKFAQATDFPGCCSSRRN
ncbi:C17orf51 isoform 2, partial [Pongo abelii]